MQGKFKNGEEFPYMFFPIVFRDTWPKTNYMKAVDVWALFCYFGVFFCLVEYCLVLHFKDKPNNKVVAVNQEASYNRALANKVDKISRIIVPLYTIGFTSVFVIIAFM